MTRQSIATIVGLALILSLAAVAHADGKDPTDPGTTASGTAATGSPATPQPKQPGSGLIDDMDPAWVWSGMSEYDDLSLNGASGHAGGPATFGTYTFHGTSVDVIGMTAPSILVDSHSHKMGAAQIIIDGRQVAVTNVNSTDVQYHVKICHVTDLKPGNHVIEIHALDGWIVLDYIQVSDSPVDVGGYTGPSVLPAGNYAIFPRNAPDKCLDVLGTTDRSQADIFTPKSGRLQVWHVTPLGKEHYRISPVSALNEALTVIGPTVNNGETIGQVGLYHYLGDPAQQWLLTSTGGPYFQLLVAAQTVAVLDVENRATTDGTVVIAYPNKGNIDNTDFNQQWAFQPVP